MSKDAIVSWSGEFASPEAERGFRDSQANQEVRQMRLIWSLALGCFLAYAPIDLLHTGHGSLIALGIRAGIVIAGVLVLLLLYHDAGRRHRDTLASLALFLAMTGYGTLIGLRPGGGAGALLLLLVGSYLFSPARFALHVATGILGSLASVAAAATVGSPGSHWLEFSYLLPANLLAAFALAQANRSRRRQYQQALQLQTEIDRRRAAQTRLAAANRRNLKLLYNALPRQVARQLRADPGCRPAREVADVAVLFADIVGFSGMARTLSAARLVELLNSLFCSFDELSALHGLEKIKTIGDAYLAVAGIDTLAGPASRAAHMALRQREEARRIGRRLGLPLTLRIGLHAGPVVAGVLGSRRYAFDVWGQSVNIAARLQAAAPAGGILVSAAARAACPEGLSFGPARSLELRGCGEISACLLQGGLEGC